MKPLSTLRLQKKSVKNRKVKKKERKVLKPIKVNFSVKTFYIHLSFNGNGMLRRQKNAFEKSKNLNKYIKTTKLLQKKRLSTPLNSIAFKGNQ